MRRLLPALALAAGAGAAAVLLPALVQPPPGAESVFRAAALRPSVWAFHGLFVVGFVLGTMLRLEWMDLPLIAASSIALFPAKAGLELALGSLDVAWPGEFLLYAAWLFPVLVGLLAGRGLRQLQSRARKRGGS